MSTFLDAMTLTHDGDNQVGQITGDWAQGRAVFGGALAGLAVRAVGPRVAADRRLRSVLVDFVSPADIGSITVESRILRAGRALTHAEARLVQGGELRAVVMLAYAADRSTGLRWPGAAAPPAVTPEGLTAFPYIDGVTPVFARQFDYRWATGALPFSGGGTPRIGGWVRLAEPVPVDDAVVLALLDAWPAPVLPLLDAPAPASTVTWMVDIVGPIDGEPDAWWRFASDAVAAAGGHASVEARLWGSDGELVAVSRQLVAEFSRP